MEDTTAIDYRALLSSPVRKEKKADLEPALEAFSMAWRPAGSMSLSERWLKAGESDEPRRSPPRPPAPPPSLKLGPPKRIKRGI